MIQFLKFIAARSSTLPPRRKFILYLQDLVHTLQMLCSLSKVSPAALDVPISLFPQSPLHNYAKAHSTVTLTVCVYSDCLSDQTRFLEGRILSCCPVIISTSHSHRYRADSQKVFIELVATIVHQLRNFKICLFLQT